MFSLSLIGINHSSE